MPTLLVLVNLSAAAAIRRYQPLLLARGPGPEQGLPGELPGTRGQRALADVRASKLLPPATPLALYEVADATPATGILRAIDDTRADMLGLIARPRSFWGELLHRSVTAAALRHTPVPVLVLPAAG